MHWLRLSVMVMLIGLALIVLAACFGAGSPTPDRSITPTPIPSPSFSGTPVRTAFPDLVLTLTYNRLAKPQPEANPPSQYDKGAELYWFVCLPCHGDQGQGLTDEWREVFGPEEMNCWQSDCHAAHHPPEGFQLPRKIPPLLGPTALQRFANGAELYHVIKTTMPWWDTTHKYLSEEDAWSATAYLLRQHGVLPRGVTLDAANASVFRLRTQAPPKTEERPMTILLVGLLAILAIGLIRLGTRQP